MRSSASRVSRPESGTVVVDRHEAEVRDLGRVVGQVARDQDHRAPGIHPHASVAGGVPRRGLEDDAGDDRGRVVGELEHPEALEWSEQQIELGASMRRRIPQRRSPIRAWKVVPRPREHRPGGGVGRETPPEVVTMQVGDDDVVDVVGRHARCRELVRQRACDAVGVRCVRGPDARVDENGRAVHPHDEAMRVRVPGRGVAEELRRVAIEDRLPPSGGGIGEALGQRLRGRLVARAARSRRRRNVGRRTASRLHPGPSVCDCGTQEVHDDARVDARGGREVRGRDPLVRGMGDRQRAGPIMIVGMRRR